MVVVPRVEAKNFAFEVVDVDGRLGVDVAAHRADHEAGGDLGPVADGQSPQAAGVVPFLLEDFRVGLGCRCV
jgi:hypothetical protein